MHWLRQTMKYYSARGNLQLSNVLSKDFHHCRLFVGLIFSSLGSDSATLPVVLVNCHWIASILCETFCHLPVSL